MLSKKSIRRRFIIQLVPASAVLIILFSIALYFFIESSIYKDIKEQLLKEAEFTAKQYREEGVNRDIGSIFTHSKDDDYSKTDVKTVINPKKGLDKPIFETKKEGNRDYLVLFYPYDKATSSYLKLTKNITNTKTLLNKILKSVLIINILAIFLIIIYAIILSKMLISPITTLTNKLAKMNEAFLVQIDTKDLPSEFNKLGDSINRLIDRIQTFVKYQKEIFIGIAHELKTPLAVMKSKNQVTLMKERDTQRYIDTIKLNIESIDSMNKMITNILEIGRQESAQFEEPKKLDLIKFLNDKIRDFKIVAEEKKKKIVVDFQTFSYETVIQPTLFMHILQNYVQNAVKFTHENGTIWIKCYTKNDDLIIDVIDEGDGIDESKDLFAPFKRYGKESGAGLGLFLAKGAADAIGATLSLKNRKDRSGAIARIVLKRNILEED